MSKFHIFGGDWVIQPVKTGKNYEELNSFILRGALSPVKL